MVNQQPQHAEGKVTCRITCYAPDAQEVFLTGSFNDWHGDALTMTKQPDGAWNADLLLTPGRYEYKFVVDGIACCEPHLKNGNLDFEACTPRACGELNRILLVR